MRALRDKAKVTPIDASREGAKANDSANDTAFEVDSAGLFKSFSRLTHAVLGELISKATVGTPYLTNSVEISCAADVSQDTVKRILTRLADQKVLKKKRAHNGSFQGVEIVLNPICNSYLQYVSNNRPAVSSAGARAVGSKPLNDRLKISFNLSEEARRLLAITEDEIKLLFPGLARIGFQAKDLEEAVCFREDIGESVNRIYQGLLHADWEAASGGFRDGKGNIVERPRRWVLKTLMKDGYYRKPDGYLSGEEWAAKEVRHEVDRKRRTEEERIAKLATEWADSLSEEERSNILRQSLGGPEHIALREYWKKHVGPSMKSATT